MRRALHVILRFAQNLGRRQERCLQRTCTLHVILSEAKNLGLASEILRFAQNDMDDFDG